MNYASVSKHGQGLWHACNICLSNIISTHSLTHICSLTEPYCGIQMMLQFLFQHYWTWKK